MRALEDLKRRLAADRRCFAFFHPALPDEPLIFVEVALVERHGRPDPAADRPAGARSATRRRPTRAIFYSINNCLEGLRGVTLGNFLIKLVVAELGAGAAAARAPSPRSRRSPASPAGCARRWAGRGRSPGRRWTAGSSTALDTPDWPEDPEAAERLRLPLSRLCARYLAREKRGGRPRDPVARFHLGNGARLERINWLGDISAKGLAKSFGLLVNYKYDTAMIERNHEALYQQWRGDPVGRGQGDAAGQHLSKSPH